MHLCARVENLRCDHTGLIDRQAVASLVDVNLASNADDTKSLYGALRVRGAVPNLECS